MSYKNSMFDPNKLNIYFFYVNKVLLLFQIIYLGVYKKSTINKTRYALVKKL